MTGTKELATPTGAAVEIYPDEVISFQIQPGTLDRLRESFGDDGPRIKCVEGSLTLVSPGRTHGLSDRRLALLILAICEALKIKLLPLGDTFIGLGGDTGYEPDESYYIQSHGHAEEDQVPDLAVEVVVTNPPTKALRAGELLGIPELWVWDIPRHRLTFYHLGPRRGGSRSYRVKDRSLAFPFLKPQEVLDRVGVPTDPTTFDAVEFLATSRRWARRVLLPRFRELRDQ